MRLSITVATVLTVAVSAQVPDWKYEGSDPSLRTVGPVVYEDTTSCVLMVAGFNGGPCVTSAWDGSAWKVKNSPHAPSFRVGHSMAYDAARRQVVLFGGSASSGFLAETWLWDGSDWTQAHPATSPTPRVAAQMAYDPVRQHVVLFGSNSLAGPTNDTWVWDGADWRQVATPTSPPASLINQICWDGNASKVILVGGTEVWHFDGSVWVPSFASTHPQTWGGAYWDPDRRLVIAFQLSDAWEWNGSTWTFQASANRPWGSIFSAVPSTAYHRPSRRSVACRLSMYFFRDTYSYGVSQGSIPGSFRPFGAGCPPTAPATAAAAPGQLPTIGRAFDLTVTAPASATTGVLALGISNTSISGHALPIPLGFLGMSDCWLLHSWDEASTVLVPAAAGFTATLPIPNDPTLVRSTVFVQAAVIAPGANSLGVVSTNASELLIGT